MKAHRSITTLLAAAFLIPFAIQAASTVTFDNKSGKPALVKLTGPTSTSVEVQNGEKGTVNASAGHYFIKIRYGTPGAYSYSKGDEFDVTETATTASAITITLHKVVAGNYGSKSISESEFGAEERQEKANEQRPKSAEKQAGETGAAEQRPPTAQEASTFAGYFHSGFYDKHASAVGFAFDPTRKEFARSPRAGFSSQKLLQELAKDAADIEELSGSIRGMAGQMLGRFEGREIGDSLFVMLFPKREIKGPSTKKVETLRTFQPGSASTLKIIEAQFGAPTEKERFDGPLWLKLGIDNVVYWWEGVGVAVASNGEVTHVLVRSAPQSATRSTSQAEFSDPQTSNPSPTNRNPAATVQPSPTQSTNEAELMLTGELTNLAAHCTFNKIPTLKTNESLLLIVWLTSSDGPPLTRTIIEAPQGDGVGHYGIYAEENLKFDAFFAKILDSAQSGNFGYRFCRLRETPVEIGTPWQLSVTRCMFGSQTIKLGPEGFRWNFDLSLFKRGALASAVVIVDKAGKGIELVRYITPVSTKRLPALTP